MKMESRTHNSRFAKAGVSCFYDNQLLNPSFMHPMKFSASKSASSPSAKPFTANNNLLA
jgi:hypothetical protein